MLRGCACILAALSIAGAMAAAADDELTDGSILVADPKLRDPNFANTVVVLIAYGDGGSAGLILNRESDTPLSKIMSGVKEAAGRKDLVFEGGPVETKSVLALVRSRERRAGMRHIFGDVYAILSEETLKQTLSTGAGSNALRFYLGSAGWGPGQLDAEVDAGAWHILKGDAATIFDPNPDSLWDRLTRRATLRVANSPHR